MHYLDKNTTIRSQTLLETTLTGLVFEGDIYEYAPSPPPPLKMARSAETCSGSNLVFVFLLK
jgi:hypothetical protein